ncbi:MAG: hypothetical protein Q9160_004526 [Pyrenula sp. 1 TL-2023]
MATPTRVLRLTGSYYRNASVSEEDFHDFMSHRHGVECAKVHAKYGILKYQMAFNTKSTRALAASMQLPYPIDEHDLMIEFYFRNVDSLLAISADEDFKNLHTECEPYLQQDRTTVTTTWIEVYLENGMLVNIDESSSGEAKSLQPPFAELADIRVAERPVAKYY